MKSSHAHAVVNPHSMLCVSEAQTAWDTPQKTEEWDGYISSISHMVFMMKDQTRQSLECMQFTQVSEGEEWKTKTKKHFPKVI